MFDRSFIDRILELGQIQRLFISDREYTDKKVVPALLPTPDPVKVKTLTAIKDYLTDNPDALLMGGTFAHIVSEDCVLISSALDGPFRQRHTYMAAVTLNPKFAFGQYYPVEGFILALQTGFVPDENVAKIIKIVGNLTDGKTTNFSDDGVSQQVTAKTSITRVDNVPVPSPVTLRPYRTFLEIEQPASPFIFRIKPGVNEPACALFTADGEAWRTTAMISIKAWLTDNLPSGLKVLA